MDSARPLRLLVAGLSWPPETFLKRLLIGLAQSGIEVVVASPKRPDGMPLQWISAPSWSGPSPVRLIRSVGSAAAAWARAPAEAKLVLGDDHRVGTRRQVRALHDLAPLIGRDWDVLYFPWNSAAAAHLPLFNIERPVIVSCRGAQLNIAPHNPRRRADVIRYFAALERATVVHCVSDDLESIVVEKGTPRDKVRVIRPAVDPSFFCPGNVTARPQQGLRLVSTGSLIWRKGHESLLLALRALLDDDWRAQLRVIGDGPERQRVLYTIRDLGLGDAVVLLGQLDETQVRDELRQADIFVLSSLSEGISNAALEAMSCGLPVVSTDVGGMPEAIREGVEGLLVPARDPSAMARAIARLDEDRQLRAQMGAAGRDRVVRKFGLDRHVVAWRELLDTVMQRHRVGAMP